MSTPTQGPPPTPAPPQPPQGRPDPAHRPHPAHRPDGPHRPDPAHRPDPEDVATANRASTTFVLLVVASLLTLTLPLPWQLATLGFAVGAVVAGIRALVLARRAGRAQGLVPLLAVGIGLTAMISMSVLSSTVVYDLAVARQECLARALTTSATEGCEADFRQSVEDRLERLMERATRPAR